MIQAAIGVSLTAGEVACQWQHLALELVDHLQFGVLLVDDCARVVQMNRRARKLVDGSNGLRIKGGKISADEASVEAALQRAITGASSPQDSKRSAWCRVTVPAPRGRAAIQILVASMAGGPQAAKSPQGVVLLIFGTGRLSAEAAVLMDLYGLTPTEALVASRLVAGERPARIGSAMGTTLNTVRTHMKRIFSKSGCRTQADFVHAVLTGPAALVGEPG
jgi:DNA-binding CsgD family transcriptional regulator